MDINFNLKKNIKRDEQGDAILIKHGDIEIWVDKANILHFYVTNEYSRDDTWIKFDTKQLLEALKKLIA